MRRTKSETEPCGTKTCAICGKEPGTVPCLYPDPETGESAPALACEACYEYETGQPMPPQPVCDDCGRAVCFGPFFLETEDVAPKAAGA